jgi:transposase
MADEAACPDCGEPVIRALTEKRHWQLLDPAPDPAGRVAAAPDAAGTWHARTLIADQLPAGLEKRFLPHFARAPVCRARSQARQRGIWKQVQSALAAQRRSQRGHRPAPRIRGYRRPPPP